MKGTAVLAGVMALSMTLGDFAFAQGNDRRDERGRNEQAPRGSQDNEREREGQRDRRDDERRGNERQDNERRDRDRQEQARQEQARQAQARQEQARQAQAQEQARHANEQRERERQEQVRRAYEQRDRDQARYDSERRGYQQDRRGPGAGPNHNFYRGERLTNDYHHRYYVVDDWRGHHLHRPQRGYHWVQTGADYVLVAIASGIILEVLLNN